MKRTLATLACILIVAAVCHGSESLPPQQRLDIDRFAPGVQLFTNRSYKLTEETPGFLRGMEFIRCSIMDARGLVCAEPATLYVLTPAVRKGAASQTKALQALGYERHDMPEFQLFPGRDIERVVLYTKEWRRTEIVFTMDE